jgi:glycosyltransferase involved in cell wall biosynthesis
MVVGTTVRWFDPLPITVCIPSIPVRSAELRRCLDSVIGQTYPVAAISVAVDTVREGAARTRNRALAGAQTEWVAFIDDDDTMKPFHLEYLAAHQQVTGADIIFPWFDTKPDGHDPFPMHEGREYDPDEPHAFPITTLVRRSLAVRVGGFPVNDDTGNSIGAGEDWLFWLTCRDAGARFSHLPVRTWNWFHTGYNTGGQPTRW